jgi:hypothetical protein
MHILRWETYIINVRKDIYRYYFPLKQHSQYFTYINRFLRHVKLLRDLQCVSWSNLSYCTVYDIEKKNFAKVKRTNQILRYKEN